MNPKSYEKSWIFFPPASLEQHTSNYNQSSLSLVSMGPQRNSFFVEDDLLRLYVPLIF